MMFLAIEVYYVLFFIVAAVFIIGIILIVHALSSGGFGGFTIETPQRAAGRQGEYVATNYIRSVLREGDYLFTNVSISYDGRPAELDNIIVNRYGVFIIEVKNYSGRLYGSEDDYEWVKQHTTAAGNVYQKQVKNPIKQVKREIDILARYLRSYGVSVWVDGYAMILGASSPVNSGCILTNKYDIDRAIHTNHKQPLSEKTVNSIKNLLS